MYQVLHNAREKGAELTPELNELMCEHDTIVRSTPATQPIKSPPRQRKPNSLIGVTKNGLRLCFSCKKTLPLAAPGRVIISVRGRMRQWRCNDCLTGRAGHLAARKARLG